MLAKPKIDALYVLNQLKKWAKERQDEAESECERFRQKKDTLMSAYQDGCATGYEELLKELDRLFEFEREQRTGRAWTRG